MAKPEDIPIFWDGDQDLNDAGLSTTLLGLLQDVGITNEETSGPFLALGAGYGVAERDIANRLNLSEVVLVDKEPPPLENYFGEYFESDIFDFLEYTERRFGFVTIIGCDYFIGGSNWPKLMSGLVKVCSLGAIVVIHSAPYRYQELGNLQAFKILINSQSPLVLQKT